MKQLSTLRKRATVVVAVVLAACLFFVAAAITRIKPAAAETDDYENWTKTVSISNSQFADTGAGDIPAPNNWTGASVIEGIGAAVKSGVLKLDEYDESNKDNYNLDIYEEYKTKAPESPFGHGSDPSKPGYYEGANRNVLLINADNKRATFGYTSDSFTLAPNSYYKISVWAKTGHISSNSGASIVVNGVTEKSAGFKGTVITSSDASGEMKGWENYTLYIETSEYKTAAATLSLQLGSDKENSLTNGYVMFDNIVATEITSKAYFSAIKGADTNDHIAVVSALESTSYMAGGTLDVPTDFGTVSGDPTTHKDVINAYNGIQKENIYGLEKQLYAPFERGETENKVFIVSTYDKNNKQFADGYGYIESKPFELKRYAYYRISAWYNGDSVEGGDGINAVLRYKHKNNPDSDDYTEAAATGLAVSTENYNHNGWSELALYVKGSDIADGYEAVLRLGLGSEKNTSKGVAMFDEVKIREITPAEYNDNSSSATKAVTIDTFTDSTGITNGSFNAVGSYDKLEYDERGDLKAPLAPSGWTKYTTAEVGTEGYSLVGVSTDDAVSGIVPVSEINPVEDWGNVLKLSSSTETAFCYRSSDFTASASSYNKLSVSLTASDLKGYGANLVLKRGGKVVATIEKITKTGVYTFYIKGGAADSTMCVELWLGLNDRSQNTTKLASGTVYFTEVAYKTDSTEDEFNAKAEQYKHDRSSDVVKYGVNSAAVSLGTEDLTLYDSYDNDDAYKTPYNWSLSKGSGVVKYGVDEIEGALVLHNVTKTYSSVTLDNTFALEADKYYKFSVQVKTSFSEEAIADEKAVGAYVKLTNGDYRFDFKSTSVTVDSITDNDAYRTYNFYIKAPSSATTTAIVLGLGDGAKTNKNIEGKVYIKNIALEDISNVDYEELTKDLKDDENLIDEYSMRVNLAASAADDSNADNADDSATDDTTDTQSHELAWWLIPSILLAVAVVIAVVGSIIKKAIENKPKKVDKKKHASYDRRMVNNNAGAKSADKSAEKPQDDFEKFNDAEEVPSDEVTEKSGEAMDGANVTDEAVKAEDATVSENATDEADKANAEEVVENADETATEATEEVKPEDAKAEEVKPEDAADKKANLDEFDD